MLAAAVAIAALGTFLVYLYVQSIQESAYADQDPVTVLVAKETVQVGTSGGAAVDGGAFEETVLPRGVVPAAARRRQAAQDRLVGVAPQGHGGERDPAPAHRGDPRQEQISPGHDPVGERDRG